MKYSGLRDRHLNVFIYYASNSSNKSIEQLENNITKAFLNTLESLSGTERARVFKELFSIDLSDQCECQYYLPWSSHDEEIGKTIDCIPINHRLLFAFSPTGKSWGPEGSDIKDIPTLKSKIEEHYKKEKPSLSAE